MRGALFVWAVPIAPPGQFVPQPNIPIEGQCDGLAWGRVDVPPHAPEWRVQMTIDPDLLRVDSPMVVADVARFLRRRFRGGGGREVFVRDGLDVDRVIEVLPHMSERAA